MKRNILLSMILLVITLGVSTSSGKIKPTPAGIHYVVFVNNSLSEKQTLCDMVIAITDGMGNIVAGPKPYQKGVSLYDFYEAKIFVYGARIARMGVIPIPELLACPAAPAPAEKTGAFWAGQTYKYQLNLGNIIPLPLSQPPSNY